MRQFHSSRYLHLRRSHTSISSLTNKFTTGYSRIGASKANLVDNLGTTTTPGNAFEETWQAGDSVSVISLLGDGFDPLCSFAGKGSWSPNRMMSWKFLAGDQPQWGHLHARLCMGHRTKVTLSERSPDQNLAGKENKGDCEETSSGC